MRSARFRCNPFRAGPGASRDSSVECRRRSAAGRPSRGGLCDRQAARRTRRLLRARQRKQVRKCNRPSCATVAANCCFARQSGSRAARPSSRRRRRRGGLRVFESVALEHFRNHHVNLIKSFAPNMQRALCAAPATAPTPPGPRACSRPPGRAPNRAQICALSRVAPRKSASCLVRRRRLAALSCLFAALCACLARSVLCISTPTKALFRLDNIACARHQLGRSVVVVHKPDQPPGQARCPKRALSLSLYQSSFWKRAAATYSRTHLAPTPAATPATPLASAHQAQRKHETRAIAPHKTREGGKSGPRTRQASQDLGVATLDKRAL